MISLASIIRNSWHATWSHTGYARSIIPAAAVPLLAGFFLLSGCTGTGHEGQEREKPNIILIYADDVGYGDIGAYRAQQIQTPNLDRLADEGVRFTDAYATSAMCTPSRYSLLTGLYAFRLEEAGILSAEDPLLIDTARTTLPGVLREAGYRTSVVGKWHLGLGKEFGALDWNGEIRPGPLEVGFDESFILPVTGDRVPTVYVEGHRVYGLSEQDDSLRVRYPEEGYHEYQENRFGEEGESPGGRENFEPLVGDLPIGLSHPDMLRYPADVQHSGTIVNGISRIGHMSGGQSAWWDDEQMTPLFVKRSKQFIREHRDRPFFLYLAMHENHVPRIPNPQFEGTSGTGLRGDVVQELDWAVGEVLGVLEELNLRKETLVIFTSDNGPVFYDGYEDGALEDHNGHDPSGIFSGGKYTAYEGGTRMPFIVNWPGHVEAGVSDAVISQVDLLASLAELTGVELPAGTELDSRDLLPALLGKSREGRGHLVQQSSDGLAVRKGPWKYIAPGSRSDWAYNRHNLGDTPLNTTPLTPEAYLFNLDEDPGETDNVAAQYPDTLNKMRDLLEEVRKEIQID